MSSSPGDRQAMAKIKRQYLEQQQDISTGRLTDQTLLGII